MHAILHSLTNSLTQSLAHPLTQTDNPIRAVYTRENKPRLLLAAAYVSCERNYLYEYKLPSQDKPRLEKAVNVDFVPFIQGVRGLRKPRLIFSRINSPIVHYGLAVSTKTDGIDLVISITDWNVRK